MSPIEHSLWSGFFFLCRNGDFVIDPLADQLPIGLLVFNTFSFFAVATALAVGAPMGALVGRFVKLFVSGQMVANGALAGMGLALAVLDLRLRWVTGVFSHWSLTLGAYKLFPATANPWFATNTGGEIAFLPLWVFGILTVLIAIWPTSRSASERLQSALIAPVYVTVVMLVGGAMILVLAGVHQLLVRSTGTMFPIANGLGEIALASVAAYAICTWLFPETTSRLTMRLGSRALLIVAAVTDLFIRLFVAKGNGDLMRRLLYPGAGGEILMIPLWTLAIAGLAVVIARGGRISTELPRQARDPPARIKL